MFIASTLVDIGIAAISALFTEIIKKKGSSLIEGIDINFSNPRMSQAIKDYVTNYVRRHSSFKILGMRESIDLDDVYTRSNFIVSAQDPYGLETIIDLNKRYHSTEDKELLYLSQEGASEIHESIDFVSKRQNLVVLGVPGSGKTTFLKKIGLESLKGNIRNQAKQRLIPVFIELRKINIEEEIDLENEIINEFKICNFPSVEVLIKKLLKRGNLILLLDGLDEIHSERRNSLLTMIQDFSDRYEKNRFIVSCRIAAYRHHRLNNFQDVELEGFKLNQIDEVISKWFKDDPQKGTDCFLQLTRDENEAVKKLAYTPLLLALVCILYKRTGQFPTNKATLYSKALRVLLEEWREGKGVKPERIYQELDTKRKELMLSEIAYDTFESNDLFIYEGRINRKVEEILYEMLPKKQYPVEGKRVLREIEIQHGIIVKQSEGFYSFSHDSFQEFLTAQYISESYKRIVSLVDKHIIDTRWQEVFLYLSGLRYNDELLSLMADKTKEFIQSNSLRQLFSWASRVTSISEKKETATHPCVRRLVAIHLAISFKLYKSPSERRTKLLMRVLVTCRQLLAQLYDGQYKKISNLLRSHLGLINYLVRIRGACQTYSTNSNPRRFSPNFTEIKDIEKAIEILDAQSKKIISFIFKLNMFREFKSEQLDHDDFSLRKNQLFMAIKNQDTLKCFDFVDFMYSFWLRTFYLDNIIIDQISSPDIDNLQMYLEGVELIYKCNDASVYRSLRIWNDIENEIFFAQWIGTLDKRKGHRSPKNGLDDDIWKG